MKYLILQNPGHNRVYYQAADKLALAELQLCYPRLSCTCSNVEVCDVEGIRYLSFESDGLLQPADIELLSRLSFVFALFKRSETKGEISLIPIRITTTKFIDNKISSLLKYQGKTNELFTKMMIRVALLSSDFDDATQLTLLDPVAGKGTTLYEASVYGMHAFGIELENRSVHEAQLFFKKYLEAERLKHHFITRQVAGKNKAEATFLHEFNYAMTKEDFAAENVLSFGLIEGTTIDADLFFDKEEFHLVVGDLPYGVLHDNKGGGKNKSKSRNPAELVQEAVPAWKKVMKTGGVIVIAWNSFLISRKKMTELFALAGLDVLNDGPYLEFEHMVDQAIKRDIVVARKAR